MAKQVAGEYETPADFEGPRRGLAIAADNDGAEPGYCDVCHNETGSNATRCATCIHAGKEPEPPFVYRFDEKTTLGQLSMVVDALERFGQRPRLRMKKMSIGLPIVEVVGDAPSGNRLQLMQGGAR